MRKRVLLVGGNFHPEPTGIGKYNGEMIDWLSDHNFECVVITTFPYYPQWKVQEPYSKKSFWFRKEVRKTTDTSIPITIIRCPHYVPGNPSGFKRLLSDFTFLFSSYLVILSLIFSEKIDYVITVAPSFSTGLLGILYKKIRGAKFLYHIQDLQIEAARDLKIIRSSFFLNALLRVEKVILREADYVSTISDGMIQKVQSKCNKEIIYFPNWADTKTFHPISNESAKISFGFKPSEKIVLYSGAIGFKQELESIIYIAKSFEIFPDVRFVICGSGPYKIYLEQLTARLCLQNVTFMPLQPYEKFNSFLNIADVHLVLQKKDTADLVMPSKLTTILSVGGLAIVTASPGTSLHQIMSSINLGILIEPENKEVLFDAIKNVVENDSVQLKRNAREYAKQHLSTDTVLYKYSEKVFNHQTEAGVAKVLDSEISPYAIAINAKARLNTMSEQ